MFSNLSIKKRLILGFGILIALFLASNIVGFTRMVAIKGNLETVVNDRLPKLMESNLVLERTLSVDRFMRTLLLEESKEGRTKYMDDIADMRKKNAEALTAIEASLTTTDAKALMANLNKDRLGLQPLYQRFYDALDKNSPEGKDILFKEYIPISLSFLQDLQRMVELQSKYMNDANDEANAYYKDAQLFSISILCAGIIIAIGCAFWNIRSIVSPLDNIRKVVSDTKTNNDFTLSVENTSHDEVGETASAFNDLLVTLRETFRKLKESIGEVAGASGNMELASQESAKASALTSESASSMAASVEELSVSINQVADNARTASDLANKAGRLSDEGGAVIDSTVKEMRSIGKTIDQVASAINNLGDQSHQISSIVQVIKEVADQTNLLALNAAIEAARAGESGRGFAVVADEVRKLAERTTKATGEISTMIEGIQVSSKSAVEAMHQTVDQVKTGRELAEETGKAIVDIRQASAEVMSVIGDISMSIAEQSAASQSIARQLEQVAQAAEENTSSAAETSSSAEQLGQLAKTMKHMTDQFKI